MVVRKVKNFYHKYKPKKGEQITAVQILAMGALAVLGLIAIGFISGVILIVAASVGLPNIHDLDKLTDAQSTTIYDREGNVLYVKHGGENRQYIEYDKMSQGIIDAIRSGSRELLSTTLQEDPGRADQRSHNSILKMPS
jgi:membrane peptidoglycan carboxypeptidase